MLRQLHTDQLQKLIDALYMENFNGFCDHLHFAEPLLSIALNDTTRLGLPCSRQGGVRPYRVQDDKVFVCDNKQHTRTRIESRYVMACLVQAAWWPKTNQAEAVRWWEECFDFIGNLPALLRLSTSRANSPLAASECLSMAADRPFHPFAHAKGELAALASAEDTHQPQIHWWAFHPNHLMTKQSAQPAELLLAEAKLAKLNAQLNRLAPGYTALPVLPTQHQTLLSAPLGFDAVNLLFSSPAGQPTSSLRTLISGKDENLHLKLSTSARTLGAIRSMPPRYLANGDEACRLLRRILEQHADLAQIVTLCDESHWWVAVQEQDLVRNPGLFGCQLRYFPKPADGQPSHLIALSALSFSHAPVWQQLLGAKTDPWQAVKDLTARFIETFLTLWGYGVMPECHGQNVIARYQGQRLSGFVLRDHDTLRICPARLKQRGLPLPDYRIDWTTPNSLVLESDRQLLAYFTTLGIQVNLYPIALAALRYIDRGETDFWSWVRTCLEDYAKTLTDDQLKQTLCETMLESEVWPFKQLLTPLLNQQTASTGMPSAMGEIPNPLHPCQANEYMSEARDHEAAR